MINFVSDINANLGSAMNYPKIDRFILKVLWWHLFVISILVVTNWFFRLADFYESPLSWRIINGAEASWSMGIAILAVLLPTFLIGKLQNHYIWRILITFCLTVYSYLLIFISGGAIEMHFHFFILTALLVVYSDWRLGWLLLVLTALHHGILNYVSPEWLYEYGRNDFSIVAHGVPVLIAIIFTTVLSNNNRAVIISLGENQKVAETKSDQLERLKHSLTTTIQNQTEQLREKISQLEKTNKFMVDRELKMVELKKKIEALQKNQIV